MAMAATTSFQRLAASALAEIGAVFEVGGADPCVPLQDLILAAARIVLHGVGREGLMMRALAMRLCHLGLSAHCVGDMGTPPVGPGDLLLVSAGPGGFPTVEALLRVAQAAGAHTAVITAQAEGSCAGLAGTVVRLPAQTMADDMATMSKASGAEQEGRGILPMGSVYEGALYIVGEVLVHQLRLRLGETPASMRERHTNLE